MTFRGNFLSPKAPFGKGAACRRCQCPRRGAPGGNAHAGVPPVAMRTIAFCVSLLPLQCPVSLPGGNRSANRSPPCQRGVVWRSQTGGIPKFAGFHMGLCFWKVPAVESLRHGEGHRGLPGRASSLSQGSLFVPGIGTAVEVDAQTKAPLAKGRLVCYSLTAPTRSIMGRRISSRIPGRDSISAGGWGSTTWARRKPFSSRVFR